VGRYEIVFKPSVLKDVRNFPDRDLQRIHARILDLAAEPRPLGCVKLSGEEFYRIRVGDYWVVYEIRDRVLLITVIKIGQRGGVYR
jgi:mRNA interferase RelE/StbE